MKRKKQNNHRAASKRCAFTDLLSSTCRAHFECHFGVGSIRACRHMRRKGARRAMRHEPIPKRHEQRNRAAYDFLTLASVLSRAFFARLLLSAMSTSLFALCAATLEPMVEISVFSIQATESESWQLCTVS